MHRAVQLSHEGQVVPYQVMLDDGQYVHIPNLRVAATETEEQPVIESEDDKTEEEPVSESADDNDLTAGQSSHGLPFWKRIVFTFGSGQMTTAPGAIPDLEPGRLGRDKGGDHRQKR